MKSPCFSITVHNDTIKFVANKSELKTLRKFINKAINGAIKEGLGSVFSHVRVNPDDPYKIRFINCVHELEKAD